MSDKTYCIYGLREKGSESIRYIGATSMHLSDRLKSHRCIKSIRRFNKKAEWVKSIKEAGGKLEIVLIEDNLNESGAFAKEIHYISLFKSFGATLTNMSNGGKNPPSCFGKPMSEKQKKMLSDARKGIPRPKTTGVNNGKSTPIAQIDKTTKEIIATFPTLISATLLTDVSISTIGKFFSKKTKYGGGYDWKQITKEEYHKSNLKFISSHKLIPYQNGKC